MQLQFLTILAHTRTRLTRIALQLLSNVLPYTPDERLVLSKQASAAPSTRALNGVSVTQLMDFSDAHTRAVIHTLKYRGFEPAVATISALLLPVLIARTTLQRDVCLIALPLHPLRARLRGYNQVELVLERCRAHELFPRTCIRADGLTRIRNTPSQTTLSKQARHANVRGAFRGNPAIVTGKHCILIDDVATTGATMKEAGRALIHAGAASVQCITFAGHLIK